MTSGNFKLTSSQAHKLTSSQAHKLTSSQAFILILCGLQFSACNILGGSSYVEDGFMQTASGGGATSSGGSCTAGTATAADALAGVTFPDGSGGMTTGTMTNRGTWTLTGAGSAFPGAGYYSAVASAPSSSNICSGTTIVGVAGSSDCTVLKTLSFTPDGGTAGGSIDFGSNIMQRITVANASAAGTAMGSISLSGADAASLTLYAGRNSVKVGNNISLVLGASDTATFFIAKTGNITSVLSASITITTAQSSSTQAITTTANTNLKYWARPEAIVFANVSDTDASGTLTDGDIINTWPDTGPVGLDVTAITTARPTYKSGSTTLNNQAVVRFDGNDYLTKTSVPGASVGSAKNGHVFAAHRYDSAYPNTIVFNWTQNPATNRILISTPWAGLIFLDWSNSDVNDGRMLVAAPATDYANMWHVYDLNRSDTTGTIWLDGVSKTTGTFITTSVLDTSVSGTLGVGYQLLGDVGDVM